MSNQAVEPNVYDVTVFQNVLVGQGTKLYCFFPFDSVLH